MGFVTYVAVEGLANRLRTHFLAHAYAICTGRKLIVDWTLVQAFGARFGDLFEVSGFLEARNGAADLSLSLLRRTSSLRFNGKLLNEGQTVESLANPRSLLVVFGEASCPWAYERDGHVLGRFKKDVLNALKPKAQIQESIESYSRHFNKPVVGIHMRRGDFGISFPESILPVEDYIAAAREFEKRNRDVTFFVASDSPACLSAFANEFPSISIQKRPRAADKSAMEVFGYENKCNRDTLVGAQEAVIDLFLLSMSNCIVGSPNSSFSKMAAFIGNKRLLLPSQVASETCLIE